MLTDKQLEQRRQAAAAGGKALVNKYGPEHMARIGKAGAKTLWTKYKLVPYGTSYYLLVNKETNQPVARIMRGG